MKSLKKLIDGVRDFSPTRENRVDVPVGDLPDKLTVHYKAGQTGCLDLKDPLAAHWAKMVKQQTQANLPIYVEIDEDTDAITDIFIPQIYSVHNVV